MTGTARLPKMMIGFVVRRCTIDLGRAPTAAEFAAWANSCGDHGERYCLFGRPIDEREAHLILKHQARLVSARSAAAHEQYVAPDDLPALGAAGPNVVRLADVRARLAGAAARARPPRRG